MPSLNLLLSTCILTIVLQSMTVGLIAWRFYRVGENFVPLKIELQTGEVLESDSENVVLRFHAKLSRPVKFPVSFAYQTLATGSFPNARAAKPGRDFLPCSGEITFEPGEVEKVVEVSVLPDFEVEGDEVFAVEFHHPQNGEFSKGKDREVLTGTIHDDDHTPTLVVETIEQSEGDSGLTTFTFPLTLSEMPKLPATVDWSVVGDTAKAGEDFLVNQGGTLTFENTRAQQVVVQVLGDILKESDEQFFLKLTDPKNMQFPGPGQTELKVAATIKNDDAPFPTIAFKDRDHTILEEGDEGERTVKVEVRLSPASLYPVTVNYQVGQSAGQTAQVGEDFLSSQGQLKFSKGTTSQFLSLTIKGDLIKEEAESFFVELLDPKNAELSLTHSKLKCKIQDDENQWTGTTLVLVLASPATVKVAKALKAGDFSTLEGNELTLGNELKKLQNEAEYAKFLLGSRLFWIEAPSGIPKRWPPEESVIPQEEKFAELFQGVENSLREYFPKKAKSSNYHVFVIWCTDINPNAYPKAEIPDFRNKMRHLELVFIGKNSRSSEHFTNKFGTENIWYMKSPETLERSLSRSIKAPASELQSP